MHPIGPPKDTETANFCILLFFVKKLTGLNSGKNIKGDEDGAKIDELTKSSGKRELGTVKKLIQ